MKLDKSGPGKVHSSNVNLLNTRNSVYMIIDIIRMRTINRSTQTHWIKFNINIQGKLLAEKDTSLT